MTAPRCRHVGGTADCPTSCLTTYGDMFYGPVFQPWFAQLLLVVNGVTIVVCLWAVLVLDSPKAAVALASSSFATAGIVLGTKRRAKPTEQ